MLQINGAKGEGGGQILRTAVALSSINQTPIKVTNIRANRPKPGLSAQHVAAIKAVAELCNAKVSELKVGARAIKFVPDKIQGGEFKFEIGTAGSITLVLQACLLPALHAEQKVKLTITGGTDVKWSPPIDYFKRVFLKLLEKMNVNIELEIIKRGYYPKGGGIVEVTIQPEKQLKKLIIPDRGEIKNISGIINLTGLPFHISDRIDKSALAKLRSYHNVNIILDSRDSVFSRGTGITLWAETGNSVIGASALGERGVPAEKVGTSAAEELVREMQGGGSVDVHAADQLLPYLGLSGGEFTVREISSHTETNIWLIEQFIDDKFIIAQNNDQLWTVKI
jgi:RNA 3'-phosphate cyclase